MHIILLAGGPGRRIWPISNSTRAKQYLRLLPSPTGQPESMVQRMARQLRLTLPQARLTAVAPGAQLDALRAQLGPEVRIVTETSRRGTAPAIARAIEVLLEEGEITPSTPVAAIPCDAYTEPGYFLALASMLEAVEKGAPLALMAVPARRASHLHGYILPQDTPAGEVQGDRAGGLMRVSRFAEKPSALDAAALMERGAMWNAGAFAFRPSLLDLTALKEGGGSFDRRVAELTPGAVAVPFRGSWRDLGNWQELCELLERQAVGNVHTEGTSDCTVINELNLPLLVHGASSLIVAASPDGILVADKSASSTIKEEVDRMAARPMYEERRWGVYKVVDTAEFPDGFSALTKQLTLNPGCSISYQRHAHRDEVWTFIDGSGEIVLDGERRPIGRGQTVSIPRGQMHALRALTPLTFIEVQTGSHLVEEDIERFDYTW